MVKKFNQQYQYETKDGTQKQAEYVSIQGDGFTAGQKIVLAQHPDGSMDITNQQRVSISDPNALPQISLLFSNPNKLLENKNQKT